MTKKTYNEIKKIIIDFISDDVRRSGMKIEDIQDDFDLIQHEHENFDWKLALSEPLPEDNWSGETGFIHQVLYDRYLKEHPAPALAAANPFLDLSEAPLEFAGRALGGVGVGACASSAFGAFRAVEQGVDASFL